MNFKYNQLYRLDADSEPFDEERFSYLSPDKFYSCDDRKDIIKAFSEDTVLLKRKDHLVYDYSDCIDTEIRLNDSLPYSLPLSVNPFLRRNPFIQNCLILVKVRVIYLPSATEKDFLDTLKPSLKFDFYIERTFHFHVWGGSPSISMWTPKFLLRDCNPDDMDEYQEREQKILDMISFKFFKHGKRKDIKIYTCVGEHRDHGRNELTQFIESHVVIETAADGRRRKKS